MDDITELLSAIAALAWPAVVLAVILLFREDIALVLRRLRKGKVLGQEIELEQDLDRLEQSASEAASQVTAPPTSQPMSDGVAAAAPGTAARVGRDPVLAILSDAAVSPRAGLMLLSSEIERRLRDLLSYYERRGQPLGTVQTAVRELVDEGALSEQVGSSIVQFWDVRNRIVHGYEGEPEEILRAIDSGITILRVLDAIPRERYFVADPHIDLYTDRSGRELDPEFHGMRLESVSPGGTIRDQVLVATKGTYRRGKQVVWARDPVDRLGMRWYRDPTTGEVQEFWHGAPISFVGYEVGEDHGHGCFLR